MFSDLFHAVTCQAVFLWWLTQRSVFNFQSRGGDLALCDEWEDVNYCPPSFFSHCFPTRVSLNNKGVVIWWQRQLASYVISPTARTPNFLIIVLSFFLQVVGRCLIDIWPRWIWSSDGEILFRWAGEIPCFSLEKYCCHDGEYCWYQITVYCWIRQWGHSFKI